MDAEILTFPMFMALKVEIMERYLIRAKMTPSEYAADLDIFVYEAYSLLSGEKIGVHLSRRFIKRHEARFAHNYIDWQTMGMVDPFPNIKKEIIESKSLTKQKWREEKRREKQKSQSEGKTSK